MNICFAEPHKYIHWRNTELRHCNTVLGSPEMNGIELSASERSGVYEKRRNG
jgi:hypothetical protein